MFYVIIHVPGPRFLSLIEWARMRENEEEEEELPKMDEMKEKQKKGSCSTLTNALSIATMELFFTYQNCCHFFQNENNSRWKRWKGEV